MLYASLNILSSALRSATAYTFGLLNDFFLFVLISEISCKLTVLAELSHESWLTLTCTGLLVARASVLTLRTRRLAL